MKLALVLVLLFAQSAETAQQTLDERVEATEKSLASLWRRVFDLTPGSYPTIDCNSSNYVEATPTNSHLAFPVACVKVEPYLEGFKITVAIGNPYSMRFGNVEGELFNGKDLATIDLDKGTAFTIDLNSGDWNRATITLNPVSAAEVRLVMMSLKINTTGAK